MGTPLTTLSTYGKEINSALRCMETQPYSVKHYLLIAELSNVCIEWPLFFATNLPRYQHRTHSPVNFLNFVQHNSSLIKKRNCSPSALQVL